MTRRHGWAAALLAAVVAACGGSGSTGLVSPEGALLNEVRRDRTCVTSDEMVTYCATGSPDAVSPGGASASGPLDVGPQPTATAGGPVPTPSPGSAATPTSAATIAASPTAAATSVPSPQPTPCATGACPRLVTLAFVVRGLPEGAACAVAARPADDARPWSTGTLVAAGGGVTTIEPALPGDVGPGVVEVALLCFEEAPAGLPTSLATLSAANPDVVFVPTETVTVPAAASA